MKRSQIQINAWLEEFIPQNLEYVKTCRLEYLENRRKEIIKEIIAWYDKLKEYGLEAYMDISKQYAELSRINKEKDAYLKPKYLEGITDDMIQQAREFPIDQLIEVKNNWAICPFHNDKNPSAYCKNNYLYCFSCKEQADTIKLYQHLYNCDFKTAVKNLT